MSAVRTSPNPFPWENTAEATGWYFHSCPMARDCGNRKYSLFLLDIFPLVIAKA